MKHEHESDLTISYTKIGDYYFPNIALPPDAGDIGIWGRRRKEFCGSIVLSCSTSCC